MTGGLVHLRGARDSIDMARTTFSGALCADNTQLVNDHLDQALLSVLAAIQAAEAEAPVVPPPHFMEFDED